MAGKPKYEVFFCDTEWKVLTKEVITKENATVQVWDKKGAVWEHTDPKGRTSLSGTLKLPDGTTYNIKLIPPRERAAKKEEPTE